MQKLSTDAKMRRVRAQPTSATSLHSNKERAFDCVYDPTYTVPSEHEILQARISAMNATIPMNVYPKFDLMFEDTPRSSRMDFLPKHQPIRRAEKRGSVSSELEHIHMIAGVGRLEGGGGRGPDSPKDCKLNRHMAITSECKIDAPGMYLFQPCTNVNVINVKLSDSNISKARFNQAQCQNFGEQKKRPMLIKTRGTQTLYRESSAQTLPYLPGVSNDEQLLENLEIFQLPTILPGDGPPGIYEVEVLERARKRWAFNKALKETFRRQLEINKENLQPKQTNILEAFEWERWMEREEYIQECQMLRLEMVIRMFEAREKKMHQASKSRIEISMEKIAARRDAALRKNEIEFGRQLRRLDIKRRNQPRCWRKENIASQFGSPGSEFYAPQMRYGVNPSRRHFVADRKAFEERMDDLEKKAVNIKRLVCPFAKLKRWSKPKSRLIEVEQNFCSDHNLKNLYESLKNLRQKSTKQKIVPKCLTAKKAPAEVAASTVSLSISEESEHLHQLEDIDFSEELNKAAEKEAQELAFRQQILEAKNRHTLLMRESHTEELEAMLAEYEGSTIGWMMKFLADESLRLQEQRKLHYLTMLAQRERWRREAAEAGLRQKENDLREIYEKLFHQSNDATIEVCTEYLQDALDVDTKDYADYKAVNNITQLARTIDGDIKRWLESFRSIQTPLNYESLRHIFKDLVFPNVSVLLQQYETQLVVESMINDVLFPEVNRLLEPIIISNDIAEEMIDRLIDNDLYLFSDDSCSSFGDECSVQEKEARAIIRKLIRRSVPGRRWMTPAERNTGECVTDILDNVFANIQITELKKAQEQEALALEKAKSKKPRSHHSLNELRTQDSHINLNKSEYSSSRPKLSDFESPNPTSELFERSQMLGNYREVDETPPEIIYRELSSADSYHHMDVDQVWEYFECPYKKYGFQIPEWYKGYVDAKKDQPVCDKSDSSEYSQLDGILKGSQSIRHKKSKSYLESSSDSVEQTPSAEVKPPLGKESTEKITAEIITEVIKSFIPAEGNEDIEEEAGEEEQHAEMSLATEEYAEEESEDNPAGALKSILGKVLEYVSDSAEEEMLEEQEEEETVLFVVNESEIKFMESNRCKCETEKKRDSLIKKWIAEGKVTVVKKSKENEEQEEQEIDEEKMDDYKGLDSIKTFEYIEESETKMSPEDADRVTLDKNDAADDTVNLTEVEEDAQDHYNEAEETIEAVVVTETTDLHVQESVTENIKDVDAIDAPIDESQNIPEHIEPSETIEAIETVPTAEILETAETTEVVETIENVETVEVAETIEIANVETVEAAENIEIANVQTMEEAVETIESANVETVEVAETVAPIEVAPNTDVVENVEAAVSAAPLDSQPVADTNDQETTQNDEVQEPEVQAGGADDPE